MIKIKIKMEMNDPLMKPVYLFYKYRIINCWFHHQEKEY